MGDYMQLTDDQIVVAQFLKANFLKLPDKDHKFAADIAIKAVNSKQASSKQFYWIAKLAKDAGFVPNTAQMVAAADTGPETHESEPIYLGDMLALIGMFTAAAGSKLKHPALMLEHAEADPEVKFTIGPVSSKYPGSIHVHTNHSFHHQDRRYYGRIAPNGVFHPHQRTPTPPTLLMMLHQLVIDPVKTVAEYGKKTGRCAFCYRNLSDPTSVLVGYGKHCAKKWGMPYGEAPKMECK